MAFAAGSSFYTVCSFAQSPPQTTTWTDGGHNGLWADPANWSNGVPTAQSYATLDVGHVSSPIIDLGGTTQSVGVLDLEIGGCTFQNGSLSAGTILAVGSGSNFTVQLQPLGGGLLHLFGGEWNPSWEHLQVHGPIGGTAGVVLDASLYSSNPYTGATTVDSYARLEANGSITNTAALYLGGGTLRLSNTATNVSGRLNPTAPIFFDHGGLDIVGNSNTATVERVGTLHVNASGSFIELESLGQPVTLVAAGLEQSAGGLASVLLSTGNKLLLDRVPAMVGAGTTPTSTGIIPFAAVTIASQYTGYTTGLATYDTHPDPADPTHPIGLRPLDVATEYATTISPSAVVAENVRLDATQTLAASATVNSLSVPGTTLTLASGANLVVNSGVLNLSDGPYSSGPSGDPVAKITGGGTLKVPGQAILPNRGQYDVPITANGMIVAGDNVVFARANAITGDLYVDGALETRTAGALGSATVHLVQGMLAFNGPSQDVANPIVVGSAYTHPADVDARGAYDPVAVRVKTGSVVTWSGPLSGFGSLEMNGNNTYYGGAKWGGVLRLTGDSTLDGLSVRNSWPTTGIIEVDGTLSPSKPGASTIDFDANLRGNGTIHGRVWGGTVSPGPDGQPGRLTVDWFGANTSGDLRLVEDIAGPRPGVDYDQLVALVGIEPEYYPPNGYGLADLEVNLSYVPTPGDTFLILDDRASGAFPGTFKDLPEGAIYTAANGVPMRISYIGGDGNDVTLTATPEPATSVTLIGATAGWLLGRRRRTRR